MARQGVNSVFKKLFLLFLGLIIVVFSVLIGFFVTYVRQQREVEISSQVNRVVNSASVMEQAGSRFSRWSSPSIPINTF